VAYIIEPMPVRIVRRKRVVGLRCDVCRKVVRRRMGCRGALPSWWQVRFETSRQLPSGRALHRIRSYHYCGAACLVAALGRGADGTVSIHYHGRKRAAFSPGSLAAAVGSVKP